MQSTWLRSVSQFTKQNSPAILSGIAVAGVIGTAVLAVKATPKAMERIEEGKFYKLADDPEADKKGPFITNVEIVKATWKFYLPAALSGAATIACIVGANTIGARRNAALVAAYALADQTFREYKEHVLEEIGELKERKIHDKMMADHMEKNPPKDGQIIMLPGGDHLIFESISGRYFRSDIEKVRRAENEFNQNILTGNVGYASLNDWWDLLGLEPTPMGDELGWNFERMLVLRFTSHLNACTSEPCLAIGYQDLPTKEYSKTF
jgi:Family of unknown function (DUF6353)